MFKNCNLKVCVFVFSYQDDDDVKLLSKVADVIHAVLGSHRESALAMFESLLPNVIKLLVSVMRGVP